MASSKEGFDTHDLKHAKQVLEETPGTCAGCWEKINDEPTAGPGLRQQLRQGLHHGARPLNLENMNWPGYWRAAAIVPNVLAAVNGVPLYRSTDELPDNIDLACAAMSSTAWPAVLQLIRRRIHVLCEHPYPASALKKALALAQERKVQFHVNGHFTNLPAPQAFIRNCRKTSQLASPRFVEIMATERSLYAALDILLSALPRPAAPSISSVESPIAVCPAGSNDGESIAPRVRAGVGHPGQRPVGGW